MKHIEYVFGLVWGGASLKLSPFVSYGKSNRFAVCLQPGGLGMLAAFIWFSVSASRLD